VKLNKTNRYKIFWRKMLRTILILCALGFFQKALAADFLEIDILTEFGFPDSVDEQAICVYTSAIDRK
jgi:hypothetical protein